MEFSKPFKYQGITILQKRVKINFFLGTRSKKIVCGLPFLQELCSYSVNSIFGVSLTRKPCVVPLPRLCNQYVNPTFVVILVTRIPCCFC